jgi:hypothetical protein
VSRVGEAPGAAVSDDGWAARARSQRVQAGGGADTPLG